MKKYRPSGRMCQSCLNAQSDCSHLDFSKMRRLKKDDDGTVVVICNNHQSNKAANDDKHCS